MATLGVSFADVSLTGSINQAVSVVAVGGSTKTTLGSSAYASGDSLLTFAGSEDLGDGVKASFKFEPKVNINGSDSKDPGLFSSNREAWVGLNGSFGTVHVGNNYTPMFIQSGSGYDPNGYTNMGSYFVSGLMSFNATNSVDYTAPKLIDGLGIQLNKGFANNTDGSTNGDSYGWGLSYSASGFTAGIGGEKTNKNKIGNGLESDLSNGSLKDVDKLSLAAAYDFGSAKVSIHRIESKSGSVTNTAMGYGVGIPLGAFTLNGNYSTLETKGAVSTIENGNGNFQAFQVGGNYSLSKRTSVYLLTGQVKAKVTTNMTSLGVVHNF